MLSNKLTFSLASLVVLLALGLVFGTIPAIADDGGQDASNDHGTPGHASQGDANTLEGSDPDHVHPVVTSITVKDADGGEPGDQAPVIATDGRPTIVIDAADATSTTTSVTEEFTLLYTFSHPILASSFTDSDVSVEEFDAVGNSLTGVATAVKTGSPAVVPDSENKQFTVVITITDTYGATTKSLSDIGLIVVSTLGNTAVTGEGSINANPWGGVTSMPSPDSKLRLAVGGPPPPPDAVATVTTDKMVHGGKRIMATFTFDATNAPSTFTDANISVTNGFVVGGAVTAVSPDPTGKKAWEAYIDPLNLSGDVTVTVQGTGIKAHATEGSVTVAAELMIPDPTGVTLTWSSDGSSLKVSWTEPTDVTNVEKYKVIWSYNPTESMEVAKGTSEYTITTIPRDCYGSESGCYLYTHNGFWGDSEV